MDWLNIHMRQIRSPAAIGSSPAEFGTWVRVLAYCCELENGGRIVGGALWKDRQWQQACAVTIRELRSADRLIQFDGNDVVVNGYPVEKEAEVQRARNRASAGAMARWGQRDAQACAQGDAQAYARAYAEGKGRGIGREGEGERKDAPPGLEHLAAALKAGGAAYSGDALEEWSTYAINDLGTETDEEAAAVVAWILRQCKAGGEAIRYARQAHGRTEAAKCHLGWIRKQRKDGAA